MAIGHVRYGTTGDNDPRQRAPIVVNHIKGRMALAHNGNIVNCEQLRRELELEGFIFLTTSDTEVHFYIITRERLKAPSIEQAVNQAMRRVKGAYSLVIMSPSKPSRYAIRTVSVLFATVRPRMDVMLSPPKAAP